MDAIGSCSAWANEEKIGKGKRVFTVLDVSFPDGRPEEVEDLGGNNIAAASVFSVQLALIDCVVVFCRREEKKKSVEMIFASVKWSQGVKPINKAKHRRVRGAEEEVWRKVRTPPFILCHFCLSDLICFWIHAAEIPQ